MTLRQVYQLPGLIPLDGVNLLLHHGLPRRVLLSFSEGARLPRAHQIQLLNEVAHRQSQHMLPCANNVVISVVAHRQLPLCRIQPLLIMNSGGGAAGPATNAAPDCGLGVATGVEGGAAGVLSLGVGELEACGDASCNILGGHCSSYSTSIVASIVLMQCLLQYLC
jgi:hypothetical protein